jgi:hypothetical protein
MIRQQVIKLRAFLKKNPIKNDIDKVFSGAAFNLLLYWEDTLKYCKHYSIAKMATVSAKSIKTAAITN